MSVKEAAKIISVMIENHYLFDFKEYELAALRIALAVLQGSQS